MLNPKRIYLASNASSVGSCLCFLPPQNRTEGLSGLVQSSLDRSSSFGTPTPGRALRTIGPTYVGPLTGPHPPSRCLNAPWSAHHTMHPHADLICLFHRRVSWRVSWRHRHVAVGHATWRKPKKGARLWRVWYEGKSEHCDDQVLYPLYPEPNS